MTEVENQPPAPEEQQRIKNEASWVELLKSEMGRVIVGQKYLVDRLIIGLLANGHVLLEGVPGLAKTLAVKTLSQCIRADFKRIQFTPDLLPADVLGTLIYSPSKGEFTTKKGPIFANLLLADEINRAPAKVQSALLEGMQERQVTIGDETYQLPQPFLVLATENPIDQEGTYPLPEAQMDRFMLKLVVDYPGRDDELRILNANANVSVSHKVNPVVDAETIFKSRKLVDGIYLDDKLKGYLVDVVLATRKPETYGASELNAFIRFGASPRATISLALASKAVAFMNGRSFVTPQDIKDVGVDVLRHRVIVTYEAEAENVSSDDIIKKIFETIPVP
ncbi:MAG: MoxR family ATPase [Verrucomicrobiota bacterium]|nr:MoxR family ATPase [Verrucomicrobiota bacterium]MEC8243524.1 MoxR family ATPase [Verrucomicrobiota bacterium]